LLDEFDVSVWSRFERRKSDLGFFADFRPKPRCTKASPFLRNSCSICRDVPQYMPAADYQAIVGTPVERG
jgi:hypothetical protein